MIQSTTPTIEGKTIREYHGVVTGEAVLGTNIFRDFFAGIRDIDYESIGEGGAMLMVSVSGTAVTVS